MLAWARKGNYWRLIVVQFGRQLRRRGGTTALVIGIVLAAALLAAGALLLGTH
jgi:hypothetical protein